MVWSGKEYNSLWPQPVCKPYTTIMSPERYAKLSAVLDNRQPDLTVLMEGIHKPHNLAAVARTADAVGVGKLHAVFASSKTGFGRVNAASGVRRFVAVQSHENIELAVTALKAKGLRVLVTALTDEAVNYRDVDYTRPTAIVTGNELEGISDTALALADEVVHIPMTGAVQSLNVSVAAALMLFEAKHQREKAGMYGECKIAESRRQQLLFQWLHPQVATYCDRHKMPYPAMDDQGFIAEKLQDRAVNTTTLASFNADMGL